MSLMQWGRGSYQLSKSSRPLTSTEWTTERHSNRVNTSKTFLSLWFSYEFCTTFLYALGNLCLLGRGRLTWNPINVQLLVWPQHHTIGGSVSCTSMSVPQPVGEQQWVPVGREWVTRIRLEETMELLRAKFRTRHVLNTRLISSLFYPSQAQ
jgi:hypothetical protein